MVVCVCPCTGAPVLDHGAGNATASVPPASWLGWALKRAEEGPGRCGARCTPGLDEAVQFTAPRPPLPAYRRRSLRRTFPGGRSPV